VLITGGAGFIGSHLCEALLKEAKIICMDDLSGADIGSIEHLLKEPDFVFIKQDVSAPFEFSQWPELKRFKVQFQGVQEIYHLACPTAPKEFEQSRVQILRANSLATLNVLEIARQWHSKLLFTSSSVVYGASSGDNRYIAEDEYGTVNHLSPHSSYDEGKRFAETAVRTFNEVYGLDTRLARVFRTYGERVRLGIGEMIPDFVLAALAGKTITIYGDKNFTTSLCYISDMADGLIKLMNTDRDPGPLNLGSDEQHNLADVARQIIAMTGSSSKVVFKDPLLFMRPQPLPDISRAKEELGWFPVVALKDGLGRMIEYTRATKHLLGAR